MGYLALIRVVCVVSVEFFESRSICWLTMKRTRQRVNPSSVGDIEDGVPELHWQPPDWFTTFENILLMRKKANAPVDSMGCHTLADKNTDSKTVRLQTLLGLMLSSQTKDEVTSSAMARLIDRGIANLTALCSIPEAELAHLLQPVSFYRTKAKNIKRVAQILTDSYDGDIPKTVEGLLALPGVGPKMAHLAMKTAWDQITGIGVDTHVHRIANRLKWVPKPTKSPEETRVALESWFPRDLWGDVNQLLVGFGQQICLPARPKCSCCLNAPICPSAAKFTSTSRRRRFRQPDTSFEEEAEEMVVKQVDSEAEVQIIRCASGGKAKSGGTTLTVPAGPCLVEADIRVHVLSFGLTQDCNFIEAGRLQTPTTRTRFGASLTLEIVEFGSPFSADEIIGWSC
ncbi:Endonuclease III-like protein 1 [Taenia crassiceps]|uniref:Endonuclease III homolog n=1 Tax=Taenia crassiceps TaxID=6207 RepID=A0ABR4QIP6_9CEST